MRAPEISLTNEGKEAALTEIRSRGHDVRVDQTETGEEWRIGRPIRNEWCHISEERETHRWHVVFGGNLKFPIILNEIFKEIIARHEGSAWIWPSGENSEQVD